jgi:hypothetical protein
MNLPPPRVWFGAYRLLNKSIDRMTPEVISPRTSRIKRYGRWEKLVALFHRRPAGEPVTHRKDCTPIQTLIHLPFRAFLK